MPGGVKTLNSEINSKEYWDERFGSGDWDEKEGREQSLFFYKLALSLIPDWLKDEIKEDRLSVLDLGCAEGEGVSLFGEFFKTDKISGADISAAAISRAKEYYPEYNFFEADVNNLPEDFDVILTSNTLEHFENPNEAIKNILPHCRKYFIMLIPFRERDRIKEHFYTFEYDSFPEKNQDFRLIYYKETDCTNMEKTQWPGEEILVVYARDGVLKGGLTLSHLENGNWDMVISERQGFSEKEKNFENSETIIKEKDAEIKALKEKIEEDRNAIMQIQFEAAQHKQAELDSRETYVWKTGLKIEKILRKTGISFVRSLLALSDYKRIGLILAIKKGINEALRRVNASKNKRLKKKLCREKFQGYKKARQDAYSLSVKSFDVPSEKGLISVVLPVYNGEDLVSFAIESVLSQTEKNFELIIVNDGSTDGTREIIEEYAKCDSRITIINQENEKLPSALSKGFSVARGEFFTWISADNVMLPTALGTMKKELLNSDSAMVFGNMKIIGKGGKVKRGHFWYEKPYFSGNVILPENIDALNTYANNTVGACFMYRASAAFVLGDYSKYKNTLESYDYWMRLNCLFKITHTKEKSPMYLYRRHENSMTARDKELGITKNRYKLMVLDDFRRDFYMWPLLWVVECEEGNSKDCEQFKKALKDAGHMMLSLEELEFLSLPEVASGATYIYLGENPDIKRVQAAGKKAKTILVSKTVKDVPCFDLYVTTNKEEKLERLEDYKGWFYAEDGESVFSLCDSKIKNNLLYQFEGMIENDEENEKKISIIICTYLRGEKLIEALWSCLRQSFSKKEYEILIVDNAPFESGIKEEIEGFGEKYSQFEGLIRYIQIPQKGLSAARNAGMWNAKGEYLLFLDDDALCDYYLLEEIYAAFKYHPEAGIVGGQVILEVPFPRPSVLLKGFESLWSQFKVSYTRYKEATQQFEFPYGANYSARKKALWRAGGFRMCYGRVGKDFAGGEETALCFKMLQIGYTIGIQPNAKVLHRVDEDRFSKEHVKKTIRAGLLTTYRFYKDLHTDIGWTIAYVKNQIRITEKEIKKLVKKQASGTEIFYKKCYLDAWKEIYDIMKTEKGAEKNV